jgi:hypothetical protein
MGVPHASLSIRRYNSLVTLAPPDSDAPLDQDIFCAQCAYNLRTKRPSELCPECAHPVTPSIELHRTGTLRHPRRAFLAALLLAAWTLQFPCFILGEILIFKLLFPIPGPIQAAFNLFFILWTYLLPTPMLIFGILYLDSAARQPLFTTTMPAKPPRLTLPGMLAVLGLLPSLLEVSTYLIYHFTGCYLPPPVGMIIQFSIKLADYAFTLVVLGATWILLRRIVRRPLNPRFATATSVLFVMLLSSYLYFTLRLIVFSTPWWDANRSGWVISWLWPIYEQIYDCFLLALCLYSAAYWITAALLFRRQSPNSPPPPI